MLSREVLCCFKSYKCPRKRAIVKVGATSLLCSATPLPFTDIKSRTISICKFAERSKIAATLPYPSGNFIPVVSGSPRELENSFSESRRREEQFGLFQLGEKIVLSACK